ncbi:hypothetical protein ACLMJK_005424 [Lecanora helva]
MSSSPSPASMLEQSAGQIVNVEETRALDSPEHSQADSPVHTPSSEHSQAASIIHVAEVRPFSLLIDTMDPAPIPNPDAELEEEEFQRAGGSPASSTSASLKTDVGSPRYSPSVSAPSAAQSATSSPGAVAGEKRKRGDDEEEESGDPDNEDEERGSTPKSKKARQDDPEPAHPASSIHKSPPRGRTKWVSSSTQPRGARYCTPPPPVWSPVTPPPTIPALAPPTAVRPSTPLPPPWSPITPPPALVQHTHTTSQAGPVRAGAVTGLNEAGQLPGLRDLGLDVFLTEAGRRAWFEGRVG